MCKNKVEELVKDLMASWSITDPMGVRKWHHIQDLIEEDMQRFLTAHDEAKDVEIERLRGVIEHLNVQLIHLTDSIDRMAGGGECVGYCVICERPFLLKDMIVTNNGEECKPCAALKGDKCR